MATAGHRLVSYDERLIGPLSNAFAAQGAIGCSDVIDNALQKDTRNWPALDTAHFRIIYTMSGPDQVGTS